MKKAVVVVLTVMALLGVATTVSQAAPIVNGGGGQLAFQDLTFTPAMPYPGQGVAVTVSYSNTGSAVLLEGTAFDYEVVIEGQNDPISGQFTLEEDLASGATGQTTFTFYTPTEQGTYALTITLSGASAVAQSFERTLTVESALPEELAQLFAGLGLFAAVMAIMAVGTEVVIESVKFVLGLKEKVTALEALEQLKQELPGQLSSLGVAPDLQQHVDTLLGGLDVTLAPVTATTDVVQAIKGGSFKESYETIQDLEAKLQALNAQIAAQQAAVDAASGSAKDQAQTALNTLTGEAERQLDALKATAVAAVHAGFEALRHKLPLASDVTTPIEEGLVTRVEAVKLGDVVDWLDDIRAVIEEKSGQWTGPWLQSQVNTYLTLGRTGAVQALDQGVLKALEELGLPAQHRDTLRDRLVGALDAVDRVARDRTQVYTQAVQHLLDGVEERRNAMQSPFRKLWRRLRASQLPLAFVCGIVVALVLWSASINMIIEPFTAVVAQGIGAAPAALISLAQVATAAVGGILTLALAIAIFGGLAWVMIAVIVWLAMGKGRPKLQAALGNQLPWKKMAADGQRPAFGSLGHFLWYGIEKPFNDARGVEQPADQYGDVDVAVKQQIETVTPTTLAKVLLQREDKHRDEETSRIRILRVVSIIVGTLLAYYLQIDAADYLNYAVPGIAEKINVVDLHALWSRIPENLTVGIFLTGLAASAGSKFWRDLLGRLQTAREQSEEAARLVRQVKGSLGMRDE
ncbi:MAG: hypothetical protein JXD18_13150 [Anaerolineae bacterium]|nr:hypothetical protein [Anaerolineae bacterium]